MGIYHTVESDAEAEIVVKKSRFIGHIVPVQSVEEAERELAKIREVHKAATHNCFAYRIGLGVPIERFSDDGEPSGTAGRPILEVLRRRPILNALVVVTRYFGGTLLGANGLIRAYADGAAQAIEAATVLRCVPMQKVSVTCDYGLYGKLEYELQQDGFSLEDKKYTDSVAFGFWVDTEGTKGVMDKIANLTGGQAHVEAANPEYVGVRPDGSMVHSVLNQG
ncbi:YigZ family protein [Alicyclobacillus curvatus]|nr:YigZ family protein [Alicyclobacillus curvatus]